MTMKFNVLQVSDKPLMSIMGDRISPETMAKRNTLFLNLLQVSLAPFWRQGQTRKCCVSILYVPQAVPPPILCDIKVDCKHRSAVSCDRFWAKSDTAIAKSVKAVWFQSRYHTKRWKCVVPTVKIAQKQLYLRQVVQEYLISCSTWMCCKPLMSYILFKVEWL